MEKIAIINACTDLGVHVNGASLGAQILTKDLCSNSTVSHCYTLKDSQTKEQANPKNPVYFFKLKSCLIFFTVWSMT